jgi:hypothetical protein
MLWLYSVIALKDCLQGARPRHLAEIGRGLYTAISVFCLIAFMQSLKVSVAHV